MPFNNIFSLIEIFINHYDYKIVTKLNFFDKMKTKFLIALLAAVFLLSVSVSAADLISLTKPSDFTKSREATSFSIENLNDTQPVNLTITEDSVELEDREGRKISISFNEFPPSLDAGDTATIDAEISVDTDFDFKDIEFGSHLLSTLTIEAQQGAETETETLSLYFVNDFCNLGSFGDLEIVEVKDKNLDNEDDWEWSPLDDVEFRVEIENNFDEKKRVNVEYQIFDENGKKVKFDDDDNEQSVSISDGDSERVTFSLRVPPDIETGNYKLFIKAYVKGHEDDIDDPEAGCIDESSDLSDTYYQKISIDREEERAVVVDLDKLVLPDFVMCGDMVTIYAKIYNIGEEDEDKVMVNLYNSEFGIDDNQVITDVEEGESATATFNFEIPKNIPENNYLFRLVTFYDYDEDDDTYDSNSKDDLDESFEFVLKVNCVPEVKPKVSVVSADLEQEEIIAGEDMDVKLVIKNTGTETSTYSVLIDEYQSWASEKQVSPRTITLDSGETKEIAISLSVSEDASDTQSFKVEILSDGEVLEERTLEVFVEPAQVSPITGNVIAEHFRENWFIWVIIVINIILIIAIIAVARRIVTSK